MKKRRHTPEQIIRKLAEGDKLLNQGEELTEVCRQLEIAESTWHRWKNTSMLEPTSLAAFGHMSASQQSMVAEALVAAANERRKLDKAS